jgi:dihydrofolate reductase
LVCKIAAILTVVFQYTSAAEAQSVRWQELQHRGVLAFMKTQYYTATSLDGFIATEDDSLDWLFPLGDVNDTSYPAFIAEVGALAMGSATYEWMLRHADKVAAETGATWPYTQPAWIFSSRALPAIEGANMRFVQGDVQSVHAEMSKAAGLKNIWIVGGGDLAGQFFDAGLLDEVVVQVGSVTLGKGKPLFPRRVTSPPLRLVSVRQVGTGFAELCYEVPRNELASAT